MRLPISVLFLLSIGLVVSGCVSIERVSEEEEEAAEEVVDLAAFETFDIAQYPLELPERVVEINHEVPDELMEVRAGAGVERTVPGFRVQIYSTESRRSATEILTEAEDWWKEYREEEDFRDFFEGAVPDEPPVYLIYRQPLYRVRVGNFTSESAARSFAEYLRDRFENAFVAQSPVTVRQ